MSGIPNSSDPKEKIVPLDIDPVEKVSIRGPKHKPTPAYYEDDAEYRFFELDHSEDSDSV